MKKLFIPIFFFIFFSLTYFLVPKTASALADCPSEVMNCPELDTYYGDCTSPCIRVVISVGQRNVPGTCQCQLSDSNNCAQEGESCLGKQCCSDVPYCWGHPGEDPPLACHNTPQTAPIPTPKTVEDYSNPLNAGGCTGETVYTAIGCIPIETNAMTAFILRWAIGIGGGIAFLLIVYAGFIIMTSSGNPDRLKAGQELLTSAIMGLILLIFSVFILKIIGVDILKIPGLSTQ